jgi:hypothetical protein
MAGTYSVTLTSVNNCTATARVDIGQDNTLAQVSINPSSTTLTCASPTVSLTALGTGSVRWSTGETTPVISVRAAGTYSVTLTSGSSCTATASVTLQEDLAPPINAQLSSGTLSCSQTSLTLTASATGGVSYRFSGGTPLGVGQVVVTTAGLYSVTITGANGCSSVAQTTVEADQQAPTAGLTNNGPLSCRQPSVTLTASGGVSYAFSGPGLSQTGALATAAVSQTGTYSVVVTGTNGCSSVAQTTVSGSVEEPLTFVQQPASASSVAPGASVTTTVSVSGSGPLTYQWYKDNLTNPVPNQTSATLSLTNVQLADAGSYSVVVTGACGSLTSTAFALQVIPNALVVSLTADPARLLTGETTSLSATVTGGTMPYSYRFQGPGVITPIGATARVTDLPVGIQSLTVVVSDATSPVSLTSSATVSVTVSAANTAPTVANAVSSQTATVGQNFVLNLAGTFTDQQTPNSLSLSASGLPAGLSLVGTTLSGTPSVSGVSTVTLTATDPGNLSASTSFVLTVNPAPVVNTAPTLANAVSSQTATVGQSYSLNLASTFTDQQTPNQLTLSASGLPAGLSLVGTTLSGTPSVSGVSTVTLTATDPGSLAASTSFVLTVSPASSVTTTAPFAITSVNTLSCTPEGNRINLSFAPQYAGTTGQPIRFSVVNELSATTAPGPYSLSLYADNPVITLSAVQAGSGVEARFVYNWLAACSNLNPGGNTPPTLANTVSSQTATVGQNFVLNLAGTFTDQQTPNQLTLSATGLPAGLSLVGTTLSGTPSVSGVSTVTLTATDPGSLSASTSFVLTVSPASSGTTTAPFAITSVSTLNCVPVGDRITIRFTPQYSGLSGQPISFSVVNELSATTNPGPYTLSLYADNPVITLSAVQAGSGAEVRFVYNWLAACQSGTSPNQPPTTSGIPSQTLLLGQPYQLDLNRYVTDPDGQALTYSASGLPAGLVLGGSVISGTPSMTGVSTVGVTGLDPGGLSVSTSFQVVVNPMPVAPGGFRIMGVTTMRCDVVSSGQRRVTFTPQYSGLDGSPVSFSVVNELAATTDAGPYRLTLYTDNPIITLSAQQAGATTTYAYSWLASCPSGARSAAPEAGVGLQVRVLGNPITGAELEVEVRGVAGQRVRLDVVDLMGKPLHSQQIGQSAAVERVRLGASALPGVFLVKVSTASQRQTVKVIKP